MSDTTSPVSTPAALPLVARARRGYCLRLLAVGLGMGAAAAWFAYDAAVTYPGHNAQHQELEKFKVAEGSEASARWPAFAKEKGYEPNYNAAENQTHTRLDIATQWALGGATLVFGLLSLGGYALARRRRVMWDGAVLSDHRGVRLEASRIETLDATRWESKGILAVRGTTAAGQPAVIELDDWKMEPEVVEAIGAAIKAQMK